jgi:hypothetical protein
MQGGGAAGAVLMVVVALMSLFLMPGEAGQRILLTITIGVTLFAMLVFSPVMGVCATMVFLSVLGGLKRWLIPVLGYQVNDPLMLVGPVIIMLIFVQRLLRRDIPWDTPVAKLTVALLVLMGLGMLNPMQGGFAVGIAGAMFYIVPLLWFYFGRFFGSAGMVRAALNCAFIIAIFTGLYGQYQQFFGFTDSEQLWMRYTGFILGVGGSSQKVFSTFPSTAEYGEFLGIGVVLSFVGILRRRAIFAPFLILFFLMMFLSGNRSIVFMALAACAVMWAVQGQNARAWLPRLIVAGVLTLFALAFSLSTINTSAIQNDTAREMVEHQVKGLSDPTSKADSGASHLSLIGHGILFGFTHPLGNGLGSTTMGMKMAGDTSVETVATEADFSNMFVSLGAVGGILYLALMVAILRALLRRWTETRSFEVLSILGILVCQLGLWLMGSHYAEAVLIWVCLGVLDRMDAQDLRSRLAKKSAAAGAVAAGRSARGARIRAEAGSAHV